MDLAAVLLTNTAALGILYDGVGIFVLGVPAMLSTTADVMRASGTAWGYSPALIRANVVLRLDTGTGSLFLIGGFLLQFFGTVGIQLAPIAGALLVAALVTLSILYWLWLRAKLADNWVAAIIASIERQIADQGAESKRK